ncbi:DUF6479 family protein [Streptomyces hirsutus]|uniref:DUF6479 family protein n=1 Tax=Streptomyces hirsutus TaxID=35620 RepID=UPI003D15F83F
MPEGGPVREVCERREPDEMPRGGDRLGPHDLHGGSSGSRTGTSQDRPRWDGNGRVQVGLRGPRPHRLTAARRAPPRGGSWVTGRITRPVTP